MLLSLRLGGHSHMEPEFVDRLIGEIKKHGKCFDEVWIATSYGMLSHEQCRENAENMRLTAEKFENIGICPSMQVSRTVGHGDNLLTIFGKDGIKGLVLDKVTGIDGAESVAQFCWNNTDFRKYIYDTIKIYASFGPHTVWVDDDLRIRNIGKSRALCFCKNCIRLFNEKYSCNYTRETLAKDFIENGNIRKSFVQFHTDSIAELAQVISQATHEASPKSRMALQNGGNTALAANAQKACLDAMKKVTGIPPAFRAGGGFYDDHDPEQMLDKAIQLNYLNTRLPDYVTSKSCEIENLPWIAYGKSHECTCIEASLYMAYGCNTASVTLMEEREPMSYHSGLFERLAKYRPYLTALSEKATETKNAGICIYQPKNSHLVYKGADADKNWNNTSIWGFKKLMRCGIPFHAGPDGDVYILSSSACEYISDEDMEILLRSPVITDAAAIEKLAEKGYFDKACISVKKVPQKDGFCGYEKCTRHVINDGLALDGWNDTSFYTSEPRYIISGNSIEPVSEYYSYEGHTLLGCANAVLKTAHDAKWYIKSANLANGAISHDRRNQLVSASKYICGKTLDAYIATTEQAVIVPRNDSGGKTVSVTLLSVSITDCDNMEIAVRAPKNTEKCVLIDPYGENKEIKLCKKDGIYTAIIEKLAPWRTKTLIFE